MTNKVIITCPYYSEGAGGVATFYKVYAEKQTQSACLFYIGKDKPCGMIRTLSLLLWQYLKLFFIMPKYDLLVVNPSLKPNAISRDTFSVRIARFWKKKTCVFWRGFDEEFYNTEVKQNHRQKLQKGLFNVDYTIVLGRKIYEKYHELGLNTPYSFGSTMLDGDLLRSTSKVFSEQRFTILFLARLIKGKGIFESLEAFKAFHQNHPETVFIVAGSGEAAEAVKEYVTSNQLQNVTLMGDVRGERKKACYESADVYLFPSYTEGMPNSVLEALGMGLPIITSSVGAVPDFFEGGKMGVLMQGHSSGEILAALEALYAKKDEFTEISEYNRQFAAENFVDEVVIRKLEETFDSI